MWCASRRGFLAAAAATTGCRMMRGVADEPPRPSSLRAAWYGLPGPRSNGGVSVVDDNHTAWAARWALLSTARSSIDASYFLIDADVFGLAFLGRLLERADAGVTVRLLVDARGSQGLTISGRDHLQELVHAGVDVRIFNPPLPQVLRALLEASPTALACATHNKILVVDDATAITGGRNIGHLYYSSAAEHPGAFIDADVILDGTDAVADVAAVMNEEFEARENESVPADFINLVSRRDELLLIAAAMEAWVTGSVARGPTDVVVDALESCALRALAHRRLTDQLVDPAALHAARPHLAELSRATSLWSSVPARGVQRFVVETRVVSASARVKRRDDSLNDALVQAIAGARDRIVLESPYFVPSPRLVRALEEASRRGVSITLLTNSPLSSDNDASQALFIDSWPEFVARVPTLRVFAGATAQTLHAKRAVFDEQLTFVGTYNIDPFSSSVNSELMVATWSERFAAATSREHAQRLRDGTMVEYLVERDSAGGARRVASGLPDSGRVLVRFGPEQHTPRVHLERLRALKSLLLGQAALWDFDVMVW